MIILLFIIKKPTDKRIKECLKDIESNFTELINAIIWYEQKNMDDWATDIVGEIEKLSSEKAVALLINDLSNRKDEDFAVYAYQRLWWALINTETEEVNKAILDFSNNSEKGQKLKDLLKKWFEQLDDDSDTKPNIGKLINSSSKLKP